ncbi:hypothetical protein SLA2020_455770 [Shorea laevis]
MYVYELIDEETHTWRRELVLELFNPYEAHLILSLPLSWVNREDGWTWNFTRHGGFSVRSGYHQAMHVHNSIVGPSSSSPSFKGDCLWHLNIPEKLKLFLGQSYCDILPTKDNLLCRRVNVDSECPMCNLEDESVLHCLKSCQVAHAVWIGCPLSLRVSEIQADTFADCFNSISTLLQMEQLELFCVLCWKIWHARNELLWNGKSVNPRHIIEHSLHFLADYRRATLLKGGAKPSRNRNGTRWTPPLADCVKINIDAALSWQQRTSGMGAVARDSSGEVLAALSCKGQEVSAAEIAEACSLREALQWAQELCFRKVIMESDCASIVTAINSDIPTMHSSLGFILSDCRILMASFLSCTIQHVHREGNSVAHELAKRALHAEADEYWIKEVPTDIAQLVTGDIADTCNL